MDVSSNLKDDICNFFVQAGQEEVSESCNENTVDLLNANISAIPTTSAFVPDNLVKEKLKLKEEIFSLKIKL